ncbi:MAG TPA: PP2C family protein-serine/threonine phosphatase [Vicinamibacteria bacterium]|nr:PP2C family protein-serine/threonine phosphatase [Vicinamibacteria bacterium]
MPFDAKYLYRRLDALLAGLDPRRSQGKVLETFLEESFRALQGELRLRAGLLYAEERDSFALRKTVGTPGTPIADNLSATGPPLSLVLEHRTYVFGEPQADASPARMGLLPPGASAALIVGRRPKRHVLFFLLDHGWVLEELDFALNTVRAALGSRLSDERVRGSVREAAEIQQSLLMDEPPDFPGFDLACRSVPTEEVGGDFYDFLTFGGEMLGLAIGDASGHGLPAALLVRDVVTGLRMGIEKDLKVAYVFSKLNRVIHRSNLSSRFISVFYGELEADGNLIYVNAGHFPPILFFKNPAGPQMQMELATGGTVIGPLPEAQFRRGFARVRPGEVLVLCTDGILERRDAKGEFFGTEGLSAVVRQNMDAGAQEILDRVFETTIAFGEGRPFDDDATLVVVKRALA